MHEQHLIRPSNKLQPFRTGHPHPTLPLTTHYADCFRLSTIGHSPPFYDYFRPSTTILGLFSAVHDHSTTVCGRLRLAVHDHCTTIFGRPRPLYDCFRPSTTIVRLFSAVHDHSTTVFGCPRPFYDCFRPSTIWSLHDPLRPCKTLSDCPQPFLRPFTTFRMYGAQTSDIVIILVVMWISRFLFCLEFFVTWIRMA